MHTLRNAAICISALTDGMLWCFVIVEQNAPCLILFFQFKIFKYEPEAIVVLVSKLQLSSLSDVSNYNLQHYGFCAVKKQIKRLHVSSVQLFLCAACYSASLNKMFSQLEYAFKTANRWLSGYFDSNTVWQSGFSVSGQKFQHFVTSLQICIVVAERVAVY